MKKQGGLPVAAVFTLILVSLQAGFFCCPTLRASSPSVQINEIAWMGTGVSTSDEWIELKNNTSGDIDMTGWTLAAADGSPKINLAGVAGAGAYYLLERTDDNSAPEAAADLIYSGSLDNGGESLELKDGEGNIIDSLDSSSGWAGGNNTSKLTMERNEKSIEAGWGDSLNPGGTPRSLNSYIGTSAPSYQCGNSTVEPGENCDDGNLSAGDGCDAACRMEAAEAEDPPSDGTQPTASAITAIKYKPGDVLINEIVADPGDGEVEWVELYTKESAIDLSGWTIEDGSGAKTNLSGQISSAKNYLVISSPKGNLNNGGDIIILRDKAGTLIDQVAYGSWNDGDIENNAPAAGDPGSIARQIEGGNTFNNKNDFVATLTPTKNKSNMITGEEDALSAEDRALYQYSDGIVISEIFPNPAGSDNEKEFVEFYNSSASDVNLLGWQISDDSGQKYEIRADDKDKTIIKAGSYYVVERITSKIALNNNYDTVSLYQPLKEKPVKSIKYEKAKEGWSYNLSATGKWSWSEAVTPGKANELSKTNHAPAADFDLPARIAPGLPLVIDGSDAYDPDGDKLSYAWNFGDGATSSLESPEHTYFKAGNYKIRLLLSDGQETTKMEKSIEVAAAAVESVASGRQIATDDRDNNYRAVYINEVMPNPEGADTDGEWIEIYNYGDMKVNLLDWRLEDTSENPYTFTENFWLEAGKYLVLERAETDIALNNDVESLSLYGNQGLIDKVSYKSAKEGFAYARINNSWNWTLTPTMGSTNRITSQPMTKTGSSKTKPAAVKTASEISLEQVKNCESGDNIITSGIVAVVPGILGSQIFYIVGSSGLQIYNFKKDFPPLKIGDFITVSGEISIVNNEKRLKTDRAGDIVVRENKGTPMPMEINCDRISNEVVGVLVAVNGEIVEVKGQSVYIDDGTEEAVVYLKANTKINTAQFKIGETARITGIVSLTKTGPRILPRGNDDIQAGKARGEVLGETAANDEWEIAARDKKLELLKYLLVIAGTIIVVLAVLMVKYRIAKQNKNE